MIQNIQKKIAFLFSILFHPIFIPLIGVFIIFNSGLYNLILTSEYKKIILLIVSVGTIILPLSFIPFFLIIKVIKTIEMNEPRERIIPYFITMILYYFTYYSILRSHVPEIIKSFLLSTVISIFLTIVINSKFKISTHMIGSGGLLALVIVIIFRYNIYNQFALIFVVLISGIIAFSRLYLQSHNQKQVYLGFFLGLFSTLITMYFY